MTQELQKFSQVLSTLQNSWDEAESFSQWEPPDGTYLVRIRRISRMVHEKGYLIWRLQSQITQADDPALQGRDWTVGFFTSNWLGFVKDYLNDTVGRVPSSIKEMDILLDSTIGWLLLIQKITVERNKRAQANKEVLRVVERTANEAAAPATA